jgi:hypothetical protein
MTTRDKEMEGISKMAEAQWIVGRYVLFIFPIDF